ncbi:hypothetical protein Tco_1317202 [Tanacetum coccineum]
MRLSIRSGKDKWNGLPLLLPSLEQSRTVGFSGRVTSLFSNNNGYKLLMEIEPTSERDYSEEHVLIPISFDPPPSGECKEESHTQLEKSRKSDLQGLRGRNSTLAQTLIEIKTAKPKPVTTAATTVTSVRPRAKGIIFHDQEEHVPASTKTFSSSQSQLPQVKDKGKGKMVEPEVPLKKKDQVALDEEMARNLEAQLQAKLIEEERLARQKEEEANIALIES